MAFASRFLRCLASLGLALALLPSAPAAPAAPAARAPAASAAPLPAVWTLPAALDRAMEANAEVVAARLEVEREEGARWQIRARMLPRVTALASTDERDSSLIDRSPSEFSQPPSQRSAVAKWGYDLRIEVRQMLFDGRATSHMVERQRLRREQAELRIASVAAEVVTAVRQSYDAVLVRRAQLAAETQRVADLSQLADYAARKQAVGEIAELDLLNARSLLETARAEQADIERELTLAEQQFARLLQLPESAGPVALEGEFAMRTFELEYSTAAALAFKRRPDLESAVLAVEASRRQLKSLDGDRLPRFDAFASWSNRSSYYDSSRTLDGWTIGASGNWSLFDGGETRGKRRIALAERRLAEVRLDDLELQIGSRLRELYQALAQTRKTMAAQENGRQFATRAFQASRRLYENGQTSLEKVLQAQMISRQADNRYLEAVFRYNVTVAQIEQAIGGTATE